MKNQSEDIFDRRRRVGLEDCAVVGDKVVSGAAGVKPAEKARTRVQDYCDDPFRTGCSEKPNYFHQGEAGAVCGKCFEKMLQKRKIQDPDEWDVAIW